METNIIHNAKFWKPNIKEDIILYKGHFNTFEFDKHIHEEYTITLVQEGQMKTFLNGFSYDFGKSTILTLNPDEVHACKTHSGEGYKYNSIYFKPSFLQNIFNDYTSLDNIYFNKRTLENQNIIPKTVFFNISR